MASKCTPMYFATVIFVLLISSVHSDTPANCSYGDILGTWIFSVSTADRNAGNNINCTKIDQPTTDVAINLLYPNVAQDAIGNKGFWTLIYNQGFEVVIDGRKYFAFSKYEKVGSKVVSYCDETKPGWSHDILGHNWACFVGKKVQRTVPNIHAEGSNNPSWITRRTYKPNEAFINEINTVQKSWVATSYHEYVNMTLEFMRNRAGGLKSRIHGRPNAATVTAEHERLASALPTEFDWRNVDGVDYVSPVRNQGGCGSCYSFSSVGMSEARFRILTQNKLKLVFSTQDIVECSEYSQGCAGGFPYLIAGKYAEDFGFVQEKCNPYKGKDGKCHTDKKCTRFYSTKYRYVGGYYGACNEMLMKIALVNDGPMSVSFEVYSDFMQYKGGIYHHTGLTDGFNPFEITNHAVLLVGYGEEKGENYWIVKNSWGASWGENGYFRIRRGTDECAIESIAVESFPII